MGGGAAVASTGPTCSISIYSSCLAGICISDMMLCGPADIDGVSVVIISSR